MHVQKRYLFLGVNVNSIIKPVFLFHTPIIAIFYTKNIEKHMRIMQE